jgi:hypothetical protein
MWNLKATSESDWAMAQRHFWSAPRSDPVMVRWDFGMFAGAENENCCVAMQ